MSEIVKAREILALVRNALATRSDPLAQDVSTAIELMHRDKHKPVRATASSNPMTSSIEGSIIHLIDNAPDMSTQEIAAIVGVNSGRVSEVLKGKKNDHG